MKKRSFSTLSPYIFLIFSLVLGSLLLFADAAFAGKAKFTLQSARGKVEIQTAGKGEWETVSRGVRDAALGDHVRTGKDGSVVIVTDDGSRIAMGADTEIVLREPEKPKGWRVILGRIKAFITNSDRLEVRTPGAIAAVEGTTLQIDVSEDGTSVLTVVEGKVEFFNELGSVTVLGSQQSTARVGEAPSRPIVVDPSSLTAWEANLQTMAIALEYPLRSTNQELLKEIASKVQELIAAQPENALARAGFATILLDQHENEKALEYAESAVDLAPEDKNIRGILGYALLHAGRLVEANEQFALAIESYPEEITWRIGPALVALSQRDTETAIQLLEEAAQVAPDNAYPLAFVTAAQLRAGDLVKANASIKEAISIDSDNYLANTYLAYVCLAQGETEAAVAAADKAVRLAPQSTLAHEALGNALFYAGEFAAARQQLDQALEINPLSPGTHLTYAKLLAAEGDVEAALISAQYAVGLDTENAPARSTLGLLFLLNNDPERAGRQFQQALALDPSLADAHTGWGQVLQKRGRFREAVEQQKLAVSFDTDSASAQNNLGGVYASRGEMALAQEHLERAIELQPGWGLPYANLALLYLEQNQYRKALDAGEKAVELGERSAFAHTVLARIYMKQGRTTRALSELRYAVALDKNYPQAHYQLAQLYVQQDRSRDAVREILTSLSRDPSAMLETREYARTENTLAAGSDDRVYLDARHSDQSDDGRLSYFLSGMYEESDGFRPVNQDSEEKFMEVITGHQSSPDEQLIFFGTIFDSESGLPGPEMLGFDGDIDDRRDFDGYDALMAYRKRLSSKVTGTLKYTYRTSDFVFSNPDALTFEDPNPFLKLTDEYSQNIPEIRLDADLNDASSLSLGYARSWDRMRQGGTFWEFDFFLGDFVQSSYSTLYTPETDTAWLELETSMNDRMQLTLGGYWGRETGSPSTLAPKIVALYRPQPAIWWSLTVSPLFRADAAELAPVEAFADPKGLSYLNFASGGRGHSYELRYQRQMDRSSTLTTSVAYQDVKDLLIDVEDPVASALPLRLYVERGHRWVADASYEQWFSDKLSGRVWGRWQSSRGDFPYDFVSDKQWPYTPKWQTGVRLDYIDDSGLRVGCEAISVDRRFHDAENLTHVDGYNLYNLRFQYQRNLHSNYIFNVMNLTDKDYEDFAGYPQSGRTYLVGLEYRY